MEHLCFESSKISTQMFATVTDPAIGKVEQMTYSLLQSAPTSIKETYTIKFSFDFDLYIQLCVFSCSNLVYFLL